MKADSWILSQPWALDATHLENMLAVARRVSLDDVKAVLAKEGEPLKGTETASIREGVAIVPVQGTISRYANMFQYFCGGTSTGMLARDIRAAIDNPEVSAIVLEIDSPGGQATGIGELAEQVRAGTSRKPIVAYIAGQGCSAAYWIASAASEVVINSSAMAGSIGTIMAIPRDDASGETVEFVSSQSPNKNPSTETKEGRAQYQKIVDDMSTVFIESVAEYRELTPEAVVNQFGAGGVKIGKEAVAAGMADRIGNLEALISELSTGGSAEASSHSKRGAPAVASSQESPKMKFSLKSVLAAWSKNPDADMIELDEAEAGPEAIENNRPLVQQALATPPKQAGPTSREIELEAKLAELSAKLAAGQVDANAQWFATQLAASRVIPAEKDAVLTVLGGLSDKPEVLATYKASIEARKSHGLTSEAIPTDAAKAEAFLRDGGFSVLPEASATPDEAEAAKEKAILAEMLAAAEIGD